jgi:hypothetical protein
MNDFFTRVHALLLLAKLSWSNLTSDSAVPTAEELLSAGTIGGAGYIIDLIQTEKASIVDCWG